MITDNEYFLDKYTVQVPSTAQCEYINQTRIVRGETSRWNQNSYHRNPIRVPYFNFRQVLSALKYKNTMLLNTRLSIFYIGDVHKVNGVERYFLVWTKKFKSVKEVPGYVS